MKDFFLRFVKKSWKIIKFHLKWVKMGPLRLRFYFLGYFDMAISVLILPDSLDSVFGSFLRISWPKNFSKIAYHYSMDGLDGMDAMQAMPAVPATPCMPWYACHAWYFLCTSTSRNIFSLVHMLPQAAFLWTTTLPRPQPCRKRFFFVKKLLFLILSVAAGAFCFVKKPYIMVK